MTICEECKKEPAFYQLVECLTWKCKKCLGEEYVKHLIRLYREGSPYIDRSRFQIGGN